MDNNLVSRMEYDVNVVHHVMNPHYMLRNVHLSPVYILNLSFPLYFITKVMPCLVIILCRHGSFKRYYSSGPRSTSSPKAPYPLPEEAAARVSWRYFAIVWHHVFHLFQELQTSCSVHVSLFNLSYFWILFTSLLISFISDFLLQPGFGIAGIGGLFLFLHYNDEKRAVPKGDLISAFQFYC